MGETLPVSGRRKREMAIPQPLSIHQNRIVSSNIGRTGKAEYLTMETGEKCADYTNSPDQGSSCRAGSSSVFFVSARENPSYPPMTLPEALPRRCSASVAMMPLPVQSSV